MFSPVGGRDELVGRRLYTLADTLCDGSILPLLTHLAKSKKLTEKQQESLLSLASEIADPSQGKTRTKTKRKR